jgi:hypothetical protein
MKLNDTESKIDECVSILGGKKVSALFNNNLNFDNADYWFEKYNVVAELKCLAEDMAQDKNIQNKIHKIIENHYFSENSKIVVFGTRRIQYIDI